MSSQGFVHKFIQEGIMGIGHMISFPYILMLLEMILRNDNSSMLYLILNSPSNVVAVFLASVYLKEKW